MSATVVIAIKPFQSPTDKRGEELKFFKVGVEALLSGAGVVLSTPDYASSPVALEDKPGFFKRLYGQPLDRRALSARIAADVEMRLKAIAGWQDKLRRIIWAFINPETQSKPEPIEGFNILFEKYLFKNETFTLDHLIDFELMIDKIVYVVFREKFEEFGLTNDLLLEMERYAKKTLYTIRMNVYRQCSSIVERDRKIKIHQYILDNIVPATREMLFVYGIN